MSNYVLRICLDLNIWCAALLADRKGKENTASQKLVTLVREGVCIWEDVKVSLRLIISLPMLERLNLVLRRDFKLSSDTANQYINLIEQYAYPNPRLILGGGVVRLEDTEDAQVLETAIASQCDLLVIANLRDFLDTDVEVIQEDRWAVYHAPNHEIYIIHPFLAAHWLNYFYS